MKFRILVVEDDPASGAALSRMLKNIGYEVVSATNVAEGMAGLETKPRCIVLDLMLPDGSGIDILRHIRQQGLRVKVAVTTAITDSNVLHDVQDLHADALFRKPLDIPELMSWLRAA
jgi:DNA-binding response OmpR family regulator